MVKLKRKFFQRNTIIVAKDLLGKILARRIGNKVLLGMIVETEAYRGKDDPGSHVYKKITERNKIMLGPPGYAYVYLCYGNNYLLNIITEKEGNAGAVLIRALEPLENIDLMMKNRNINNIFELTNGPGKLTQAFNIDKRFNGCDVVESDELYLLAPKIKRNFIIISTSRVGIKKGIEKNWRFYIKDNKFVSVK